MFQKQRVSSEPWTDSVHIRVFTRVNGLRKFFVVDYYLDTSLTILDACTRNKENKAIINNE